MSSSSPTEQLCYVHCNCCDAVLVVNVPSTSFSKTVMVRCGHCKNLLSVNMEGIDPSCSKSTASTAQVQNLEV